MQQEELFNNLNRKRLYENLINVIHRKNLICLKNALSNVTNISMSTIQLPTSNIHSNGCLSNGLLSKNVKCNHTIAYNSVVRV